MPQIYIEKDISRTLCLKYLPGDLKNTDPLISFSEFDSVGQCIDPPPPSYSRYGHIWEILAPVASL